MFLLELLAEKACSVSIVSQYTLEHYSIHSLNGHILPFAVIEAEFALIATVWHHFLLIQSNLL